MAGAPNQTEKENMNMNKLTMVIAVAGMAGVMSAEASLTVGFVNVSPEADVNLVVQNTTAGITSFTGAVQAGIYNLTVNGVATPSFCIDVDRDAPGTGGLTGHNPLTDYSYTALSSAPLTPSGPMGSAIATDIEKMWTAYFSPAAGATQEAGLQLAIWELLGNGGLIGGGSVPNLGYRVTSSGAINAEANIMLTALFGGGLNSDAPAHLVGLTSPDGQNYVVAAPVPEPTTIIAGALLLMPFGACTVRALRKKQA